MPVVGSAVSAGAAAELKEDCPCTKKGCELHGHCAACRAKHGAKGKLPRCER
jgi:hypothetical protein